MTLDLFSWVPPQSAPPPLPKAPTARGFTMRDYQRQAADTGKDFLHRPYDGKNDVIVIPTGGGKSVVIADIAKDARGDTLVLQPNKEILAQNFRKITATGAQDVGIYSASFNSRSVKKITLATIGSIYKNPELFNHFSQILVDECDLVNPEEGMYKNFFKAINKPVLGLTASPWRLTKGAKVGEKKLPNGKRIPILSGASNVMITRSVPRVFHNLSHITQIGELYSQGYLAPLRYIESAFDRGQLALNSTGADFTEASFRRISNDVVRDAFYAARASTAKHVLIFAGLVSDARKIAEMLDNIGASVAVVTGETNPATRDRILAAFQSGAIRYVVNVGVLTAGFDFPALDHIIMARPTSSARLFYQIVGRGIRTCDGKEFCTVTDLCGNVATFGKIEDWVIADENGDKKYRLKSGEKFLTGVDLKTGKDLETPSKPVYSNVPRPEFTEIITYGQYKGTLLKRVPSSYLRWVIESFEDPEKVAQAKHEYEKRHGKIEGEQA